MTSTSTLPFSPATDALGAYGAPACQRGVASVRFRHVDNLDRPHAITDAGFIQDETGKRVSAELLAGSQTGEVHTEARFKNLVTGYASWYPPEEPNGEHLIGLDTVSEQRRFTPGDTLSYGVPLSVIQGERKLTAIHLPPPVIINLREATPASGDVLTSEQLDYFRANGNNALIFIHGYNVFDGEWGRFLNRKNSRKTNGGRGSAPLKAWHPGQATVWQNAEELSNYSATPLEDDQLNGTGARNWAIHMEYQLNRAAGFDGKNWMPYSRIINISWPGNTSATDFIQAELNAMTTGRRLVPILQQLADAGIAINLLTHSLGARVGLTALNILGTLRRRNLVDHLFLWQPAVADNALTNDSRRDVHPLGLGVFPNAHTAARKIVVLYSRQDGILGPRDASDDSPLKNALSETSPAGMFIWNIANSDDRTDDTLGYASGVYPKKWWTFPEQLDNGFRPAIEKLYKEYLPLRIPEHPELPSASRIRSLAGVDRFNAAFGRVKADIEENWARLERDILTEANTLWQPCIDCLRNGERPPEYTLLSPLNHRASVSISAAQNYIVQLKQLAEKNWYPEPAPRPALGYSGFDRLVGELASESDDFLKKLVDEKTVLPVDQSPWLFNHSGMRVPSPELFGEVYKRTIMQNELLANSTFGRY